MVSGHKDAEFIRNTLLVKIKDDLKGLRIFNKADMLAAAYYHSRRYFLTLPNWIIRVNPEIPGGKPDLAVFENNELRALLQLEFALAPKQFRYFPKLVFEDKAKMLKNLLSAQKNKKVSGWLFGIYDTDEAIFYPTLTDKSASGALFWLPINAREFVDYSVWRKKWDELKEKLF